MVVGGPICGFVLQPNTPQECLLPGYCIHNRGSIASIVPMIWESLVPVHMLLPLLLDLPRWVDTAGALPY